MISDDGILVKTLRWWRNLWNIRKINEIQTHQINELIFKLTMLITAFDRLKAEQLKIKQELDKLKESTKPISLEIIEDKPQFKVNKYYDPQMNVEYVDIEVNGDKASPNDDTVVEE